MAVIVKFFIVLLNKATPLRRFSWLVITVSLSLTPLLFSGTVFADVEGGAEQLRQFVRNSKTAEGEFVQQQLRAPKANEPQDKGLKVVRQTQGRFVFQRHKVACGRGSLEDVTVMWAVLGTPKPYVNPSLPHNDGVGRGLPEGSGDHI